MHALCMWTPCWGGWVLSHSNDEKGRCAPTREAPTAGRIKDVTTQKQVRNINPTKQATDAQESCAEPLSTGAHQPARPEAALRETRAGMGDEDDAESPLGAPFVGAEAISAAGGDGEEPCRPHTQEWAP